MNKRMYGAFESETVDGSRRCIFCGEWKPLSMFPRNGYDADGKQVHRQDCKICYNIRRKENKNKKAHSDFIGGQKRRGDLAPRLSHQEWKEVMIYFGGTCAFCGCTTRKNQKLTRDHLEPLSAGGGTTPDNIVPACSSCNSSKGAEEFKQWFMKQSYFSQERLNKIFTWRTIMREVGKSE